MSVSPSACPLSAGISTVTTGRIDVKCNMWTDMKIGRENPNVAKGGGESGFFVNA